MTNNPHTHSREQALVAKAADAFRNGNFKQAIEFCLQAITVYPDSPDANHLLGILYYRTGIAVKAEEHLQRAATGAPDDAHVQCNLGLVLGSLNKFPESINAYNRALEISPDFPEALYQLAVTCRQAGDNDAAISHYRKLIQCHPDMVAAYNNLGNLLAETGNIDGAIEVLEKATRLDNADHLCYYNLANTCHTAGKLGEAIEAYNRAIGLKNDFHQAYLNIGHIFDRLGRWDEEFDLYRKLQKFCPDLPELHDRLGTAYMRRGEYTSAIEEYDQALELEPDMINTICGKAELLERIREFGEASILVDRALQLDPDNAYACYISGKLLHQNGEIEKAIELIEKAKQVSKVDKITSECHLLLGQIYARTDEYRKSYKNINQGNRLIASGFDDIDSIKNRFLMELELGNEQLKMFAEAHNKGNIGDYSEGNELVFIVGFPRSGTTLLDVILESHPEIQTVEEEPVAHAMYEYYVKHFTGDSGRPANLTDQSIEKLRSIYYEELYQYADSGKTRYIVDKFPLNIARAHLIWRVFPSARFILALRHPCDVCLSCLMQNFNINSAMANFLNLPDTVNLYDKIMTRWIDLNDKLPLNHHTVKYESLVTDFRGEITSLLGFLDLEWDENLLSYQDNSNLRNLIKTPSYKQVREPIYKRAIKRWENYRTFMEPDIEPLERFIDYFGYR